MPGEFSNCCLVWAGVPRMVPVLAPLLPHEGQPFDQEFPLLANPAVPNEQLTWTRNGAPFTPDSSRTLRPYRNRLRTTSILRADSGNYTLNATNAIGFALLRVELIVQCTSNQCPMPIPKVLLRTELCSTRTHRRA